MPLKRSYYKRKYKKYKKTYKKKTFKKRPSRSKRNGMQKIRKYTYSARNIGGDRAYAKLRYVSAQTMVLDNASAAIQTLRFNTGAVSAAVSPTLAARSIFGVLGDTPNLSNLADQFLNYRIRGIKLKITAWPVTDVATVPVYIFTNAQSNNAPFNDELSAIGPTPAFATPSITVLPEQRWCRYRIVTNPGAGAKPTTLTAYYSVNKVYGPDKVVKNDTSFTGLMKTTSPYWQDTAIGSGNNEWPVLSPWLEYGIFSMTGQNIENLSVALKIEATVYAQFFGRRINEE